MISETVLNETYFPIETNVLKGDAFLAQNFLDINTNFLT